MKKIKITIGGMHCASCASNIERAVKKLKGINSVSVSVLINKAIIEAQDNISIDEIKKTISRLGYEVENIEQ
ncbi:MAG: heavy metal-associated domain-containing protein [Candidatus Nanoarchaeia archaeon]|nr:heavy metal-associated domain-containing protein [Candidatus Nanoarchaeia archaeon]